MITPFQTRAAERRAKIAADIDAAKKTLEDATTVGAGFWVSYIFLMFYIAVSAGAVTHADLLLENPVKLPFLNLDLPLLGFFFLAPILFIVMHVFTLSKLVMLAEKAKRFLEALEKLPKAEAREKVRRSLPSNIFTQFMAGPTEISGGGFGALLRLMGWITMALAPVLLLLFLQIQFLPYHSFWLTWEHRAALAIDLALLWWLWRRALNTATQTTATPPETITPAGRWESAQQKILSLWNSEALPLAQAASIIGVIFSIFVATFPFEWGAWAEGAAIRPFLSKSVFSEKMRYTHWPYNTLQLEEFDIFETLKLKDRNNLEGREFTKRLRARRLEGANLAYAKLGKVDLRDAKLMGAMLNQAELQGAKLFGAKLQGATLSWAHLQGATLEAAELQGATLNSAKLQGANLEDAELQGANLERAELQGATLDRAELQGASFIQAMLQATSLDNSKLQGATLKGVELLGASLEGTQLQGASLYGAKLQGAKLTNANLQSVDLTSALVWRADFKGSSWRDIRSVGINWNAISDSEFGQIKPWNNSTYEELRRKLEETITEDKTRNKALKRIEILKCVSDAISGNENCGKSEPKPNYKDIPEEAYTSALYKMLKFQICDGNENSIHVLRGLVRKNFYAQLKDLLVSVDVKFMFLMNNLEHSRMEDLAAYAPKLIDDIQNTVCPVSADLTATDKARLRDIKKWAEENYPPKPDPKADAPKH